MKRYGKSLVALALVGMMIIGILPSNAVEAVAATAKETVAASQETKTATTSETTKEKTSAQSSDKENETAKEAIQEGIFTDRESDTVDLSSYNLTEAEATALSDEVLEDSNASTLITTSYETDEDGIVTAMTVDMDEDLATAYDQIDAASENADNSDTELTLDDVYAYYAEYQAYIEAKPDYFGITVPYNSQKDAQGPIDSMLTMAGIKQEYIDAGIVTYSDLYGMVQLFYQGNQAAVQQFGDQLLAVKDQALSQLTDDMTVPEKLLTLNDWLANWCEFDMAMIMEDDNGDPMMVAEDAENSQFASIDSNILGLWEGNQFGALCLKSAVCAGYANAYAYLVQWAFPEVYQNADGTWKTKDELNYITNDDGEKVYSPDAAYMVDWVRISYDASVSMFGEQDDENFTSDHYWNAVKIDGQWYYVDPCYNDVYTEVMSRDRVETDGNTTHLYFLFSDDRARDMYDGNYSGIDTLYEGIATDTSYEDSWFAYAKSAVTKSDNKWYYYYDSTDIYNIMDQYGSSSSSSKSRATTNSTDDLENSDYKLVYHDATVENSDKDNSFETLVDFNNGQVLNPSTGEMVDNDLIKELYAEFEEYQEKYPSISISASLYNNKFYFSLSDCILTYDLSTGEVTKLMEYDEVSATRDKTVANGGLAFNVVDNADKADFTVTDHPIAGMVIKDDTMYVSVATNFAFISGKTSPEDKSSYGYEYEETNYNSSYNSYIANMGYSSETNDNDEFMFSANFVDSIAMSDVTGSHTYETVTVPATCNHAAYTEQRCSTCGAIKADTRKTVEGSTATEHHYVQYDEQYYTKDDDDNWNTGTSYVCTICQDAVDSLEDGVTAGHQFDLSVNWADDYESATMTVACDTCEDKKLDCLADGSAIPAKNKKATVTAQYDEGASCENGGKVTYTATLKVGGTEYTDTKTKTIEAGTGHTYTPTFVWADDHSSCTVIFSCTRGDDTCDSITLDGDNITSVADADKDCSDKEKVTYTVTYTDTEGNFGTKGTEYTDTVTAALNSHEYEATFNWDNYTCDTATLKCTQCPAIQEVKEVKVTNDSQEQKFDCEVGGTITYTATCQYEGKTYTGTVPENVEAKAHTYEFTGFNWKDDYTCTAIYTCSIDKHENTVDCDVTSETTAATYTATGSTVYTVKILAKDALDGQDHNDQKTKTLAKLTAKSSFAKSSYTVYATQSLQTELTSDYDADGITAMKSSNTKILTVSNSGVIKGVKAGKATITATTKTGETVKATVTVKTPKVTLTATSAPLQVKKSTKAIKIQSKYTTDSVEKWSTSNKKIATVDKNGKITAKKAGTATITVTMKSGAKASCKVKVQKTAVKLSKIAVNKSSVTLKLSGGTKTFSIVTTKTPVTATDKVTYKTSNKKVATVSSSGKITAKKAGNATITVKCGKKTKTVKVTVKKK
jgi:hypothetical protein